MLQDHKGLFRKYFQNKPLTIHVKCVSEKCFNKVVKYLSTNNQIADFSEFQWISLGIHGIHGNPQGSVPQIDVLVAAMY